MKRTMSILLVLVLLLCTAVAASAQGSAGQINGMASGLIMGYSGDTWLGEVHPQDERVEHIYLYDAMFTWDNGFAPATPAQLTPAQIRSAKLTVRCNASSKIVDDISINSRESRIEVTLTQELAGVDELDFDFDIYLSIDGRRYSDYGMNLSGTFANPVVEVFADDKSVDISDGTVAEAQEQIRALDVEIGHGVTVSTRLAKNKRVYGVATRTPDGMDEEVFTVHPAIGDVITLRTVGLDSAASTVRLAAVYSGFYVYDANLTLLGSGRDTLPYFGKYYLSTELLNLVEGNNGEETADTGEVPADQKEIQAADEVVDNINDNPNTGGGFTPSNVNYNPGTGR